MLCNLFLAYIKRFAFFFFILFYGFNIFFARNSDKLFERLYYLFIVNLSVIHCNLAALNAAHGFNDNSVALFKLLTVGVKIINLADLFEADAYNLCHI